MPSRKGARQYRVHDEDVECKLRLRRGPFVRCDDGEELVDVRGFAGQKKAQPTCHVADVGRLSEQNMSYAYGNLTFKSTPVENIPRFDRTRVWSPAANFGRGGVGGVQRP